MSDNESLEERVELLEDQRRREQAVVDAVNVQPSQSGYQKDVGSPAVHDAIREKGLKGRWVWSDDVADLLRSVYEGRERFDDA